MQVIIAGGGIGGLSAALCLQQQGHQVTVLEQSAAYEDIGAGIQISPNGSKVLAALGVLDDLKATAFEPEKIQMRIGITGREIFSIPLKDYAQARWGAPYLHVHRADLMAQLHQTFTQGTHQAGGCKLLLNHRVLSYQNQSNSVNVHLEDGQCLQADVLIGSDGIHSNIRQQMHGKQAPRFTGNVAWRSTVPIELLGSNIPDPTACVWVGQGRHAVTYRLRGGKVANLVGVVEQSDWQHESWTQKGDLAAFQADFSGWHPTIQKIIQASPQAYRWALLDRDPLNHWTDGRVALLGDACHPMLPFLAQGANMALEDAWVFAQQLTKAPKVEDALQQYFKQRHARTARVQKEARANMKIFHRNPSAYLPIWLAAKAKPSLFHSRQDWLYGFDVCQ